MSFDQEKFQELLAEAGFVKAPKATEVTEEQAVARVIQLMSIVDAAKLLKTEESQKAAKKARRELRKKWKVFISKLQKTVELPETILPTLEDELSS